MPSTAGSVREERCSLILPGMGVALSLAEGVTRSQIRLVSWSLKSCTP